MVNVLWVEAQLMHEFGASEPHVSHVWNGDECYQTLRVIIRHLICTLIRHKTSILIIHLLWPVWHFPLLSSSGIGLKWFCATLTSDTRRTSNALVQVLLITLLHDEINVLIKKNQTVYVKFYLTSLLIFYTLIHWTNIYWATVTNQAIW